MGNVIRINACLFTRMGYGRSRNTTDFYMNGRFQSPLNLDNLQASLENRGSDYLFSLADHMENAADTTASVSISKEMLRLHEKISVQNGDMNDKVRELSSRIGGAARMLDSILDMNHTSETDEFRRYGFSSFVFSGGTVVAATVAYGHAFLYREDGLQTLAKDTSERGKLVRLGVLSEEEAGREELDIPESEDVTDELTDSPVIFSEPIPFCENDTYLLISQGAYEALNEERIEDILGEGGDSTHFAARIVSEAMKRTSHGDLSAMVVQVEKIYDVQGSAHRPALKARVDALSRTPPVTYKYNRKPRGKDGFIFAGLMGLTAIVFIAILAIIISSFFGSEDPAKVASDTPAPSIHASAMPEVSPEVVVTPEPEGAVTPEPTPEPTSVVNNPDTYTIQKGDTMSGIVRKLYGDVKYLDAFSSYNKISDPAKIQPGQVLKVPLVDALQ